MSDADEATSEQLQLVQELDDDGQGLTSWEADRVEEWLRQLEGGKRLTSWQAAKLDEIREERL